MKAIVIGGSGFIGSYVGEELINRGYSLIIADIENNFQSNLDFEYIKCDISNNADIDFLFKREREIDFVFHLAGFANLDDASKNPYKTIQLNTLATTYILQKSIELNIQQFIFASSAYASSSKGSFYGISKLASEKIIEEFHLNHNLNYTILRYGSVYSEKNFYNNYLFNLIKSAIENKKIVHNSDGNELREYIHCSDVAKLSVDVIEEKSYLNKCFILTGIEQNSRKQIFEMIKEISGENIEIELNSTANPNHYKLSPYSFQPSISKKLIANPQIDLGQGILEIIKTIKQDEG
jgi:UDP-glucose 4-epimerase